MNGAERNGHFQTNIAKLLMVNLWSDIPLFVSIIVIDCQKLAIFSWFLNMIRAPTNNVKWCNYVATKSFSRASIALSSKWGVSVENLWDMLDDIITLNSHRRSLIGALFTTFLPFNISIWVFYLFIFYSNNFIWLYVPWKNYANS